MISQTPNRVQIIYIYMLFIQILSHSDDHNLPWWIWVTVDNHAYLQREKEEKGINILKLMWVLVINLCEIYMYLVGMEIPNFSHILWA